MISNIVIIQTISTKPRHLTQTPNTPWTCGIIVPRLNLLYSTISSLHKGSKSANIFLITSGLSTINGDKMPFAWNLLWQFVVTKLKARSVCVNTFHQILSSQIKELSRATKIIGYSLSHSWCTTWSNKFSFIYQSDWSSILFILQLTQSESAAE